MNSPKSCFILIFNVEVGAWYASVVCVHSLLSP